MAIVCMAVLVALIGRETLAGLQWITPLKYLSDLCCEILNNSLLHINI